MKKPYHFLLVLLLLACCFFVCTNSAYAADIVASGECGADGDNLTWTLDSDGVLIISGEGKMADYNNTECPWDIYRYYNEYKIKTLIIGNKVTSIGDRAFRDCEKLTSILIPDSVTSIGANAFGHCWELTSITIPESVTSIGEGAFAGCTGLTSITIPESVTSIGGQAFWGCTGLAEINYNAKNVTDLEYGNGAFYDAGTAGEGVSVTFGDTVETIPAYLFCVNNSSHAPKVTSVVIGTSVTSIGNDAFYNCTGLTSVTMPEGVTSIGNDAFYNCTGLASITMPESVTSIGDYAFHSCTGLTSITIPENVSSIGYAAFSYCTGLTEIKYNVKNVAGLDIESDVFYSVGTASEGITIVFGNAVEMIPEGLFINCLGAKNVVFSDSITSIGESAFYNCTGLTSITIGKNVTSIGESAFYNCTGLTEINYNAKNVTSTSYYVFYDAGTAGEGISVIFGDTVETIPDYLFSGCTGLTSITIHEGVISIGKYAFADCTWLTSITIPESVTSIGLQAFFNCTGLTEIRYNAKSLTSIGSNVFGDAGIEGDGITLSIGEDVEVYPNSLFINTQVKKYQVAENNAYYKEIDGIVYNKYGKILIACPNTRASSVSIPSSVRTINANAFHNCKDIKKIVFEGNKPTFEKDCFYGMTFKGYYPYNDDTWASLPGSYGASSVSWKVYSLGDPVELELGNCQGLEYERYSDLDPSTIVFYVTYTDGCIETHDLADSDSLEYDFTQLGDQTVSFTYKGFSESFDVKVYANVIIEIDGADCKQSEHPYGNDLNEEYEYEYPDAKKIAFTFSPETSVEDRSDYLYVYENGVLKCSYTGKDAAGKTVVVNGSSFSIKLVSDDSYSDYGFSLSSINVYKKVYACDNHPNWKKIVYEWSEDLKTVIAVRECSNCGERETEVASVIMEDTATCTKAGAKTYTAAFINPVFEAQKKEIASPALGHIWTSRVYDWSDDLSSVYAFCPCDNCGLIMEEETVDTIHNNTATCTEEGIDRYRAVFTNPVFSTQIKTIAVPAKGHSWRSPDWFWANDYTTASAIFACSVCSDTETVAAEIIIDGGNYTAKVIGPDGKEYTDTKVAEPQEFVLGDVTGDGEVDANDLTALSRHVARIEEFTGEALLKAADVNRDGEVDANDLTVLSRFVAKIINSFD